VVAEAAWLPHVSGYLKDKVKRLHPAGVLVLVLDHPETLQQAELDWLGVAKLSRQSADVLREDGEVGVGVTFGVIEDQGRARANLVQQQGPGF
jgi:hypothetical protein